MNSKNIFFLSLFSFLLLSCGDSAVETENLVAKGGKKYGGEFKFMAKSKVNSVFAANSVDSYSMKIISQIYEPLLSVNPKTFEVTNLVAESYTVSDDATKYTFKIRPGVYFHNDACFSKDKHELDAEDVKFSLEYACSGLEGNKLNYLLVNRIEGAQEFNKNSATSLPKSGVSGIKVIDKRTIEITLTSPQAGFEKVIAHPGLGIFPVEAFDKYKNELDKHAVGTGPFMLSSYSDDKIELVRNPNYWKVDEFGNQLPFLSKISMTYAKDKRSELLAFRASEIDMVLEIPVEEIEHILGTLIEAQEGKNIRHKVESEQSLSVVYLAMANNSELFKNELVRRAFSLAINTNSIVDEKLEGEGWAANNGIVPKIGNYPTDKVEGLGTNVEKAQQLLKEAGYPNGKGFPAITIYVADNKGSANHIVTQAIAAQLKNALNIDATVQLTSREEKGKLIQSGEAQVWIEGWLADYPDAENFMSIFYGGNISNSADINSFKFNSPEFNTLYEKILSETDETKRQDLIVQCDNIIVREAPVVPILTKDHIIMINARVRNFDANPMETLNLTSVFIKEAKPVN